jgi:hypothetical protein
MRATIRNMKAHLSIGDPHFHIPHTLWSRHTQQLQIRQQVPDRRGGLDPTHARRFRRKAPRKESSRPRGAQMLETKTRVKEQAAPSCISALVSWRYPGGTHGSRIGNPRA